jgi:hypothetical protein
MELDFWQVYAGRTLILAKLADLLQYDFMFDLD